ncbi:MAG: thiolase family protein [Armatimonadota bacterium]|nr:thiolase family protein [Armatimonadota bacterium]MDR7400658.1 thiolase family protein [Armatimonadota bacterium]MDR7403186.1 thiolase family protein [Armatimonadota bacterium]MDR7436531.1 thiolase family protein [Armatimonadota bacterium]MDR7472566.1 thiolase family protein [Armatimonadota bacterium]
MGDIVILSAARTPIGRFLGGLAAVPAPRLGAVAIAEALRRARVAPERVDEVIMGQVLTSGVGQAPARQAALYAGLPSSVPATTVNKMCGSGLKAVMLGAQAIAAGDAQVVVAGGMENMSAVPYLLPRARTGLRLGDATLVDALLQDGLVDAYRRLHMGNCAELLAREYRISREEQDDFARRSYTRALEALDTGLFAAEIAPVPVPSDGGTRLVAEDEEPRRVDFARIPALRPAFEEGGTVTAANASSISDGAAAVVLASADAARRMDVQPLARVVGQATAALEPEWFTIAPARAIRLLLDKVGWRLEDVDLFEINEAFAAVVLGVCRDLGLSLDRVNVHGGAVALGHPIGCSGARILTTLLHALPRHGARRGVAAVCLAGGEAVAVAVEAL